MATHKRKKGNRKLLYLLATLFLIAIGFTCYLVVSSPLDTKIVEAKFLVGNTTAFDLNTTALTFGKITPGFTAIRKINLYNPYSFDIKINAYASKTLADYIVIKDEDLHVPSLENKSIPINVNIPKNMTFGKYSGKIVFKIYKE